jgi:uncharacterized membrane protein HdeD (DUF308 family)
LPGLSPTASDVGAARTLLKAHWVAFLASGIVMVALGILAVILPNVSSLGVELVVGWLFLVGGVVRAVHLMTKQHPSGYWWSVLGAAAASVLGACLIFMPLQGVVTLALVLTALFAVEGIAAVFGAFDIRHRGARSVWLLVSGIINLGLAVLIWMQWPSSAAWLVGLYAGINLIFIGIPLIATAIAAHESSDSR